MLQLEINTINPRPSQIQGAELIAQKMDQGRLEMLRDSLKSEYERAQLEFPAPATLQYSKMMLDAAEKELQHRAKKSIHN